MPNSKQSNELDFLLDLIRPRWKKMLQLRYGLKDGKKRTYKQVAEEMGVTTSRARQVCRHAMKILKKYVRIRSKELRI